MLKFRNDPESKSLVGPSYPQDPQGSGLDLAAMLGVMRRQWPLIALVASVILTIAVTYLLTATPRFTASAMVLIDTRKNQLFANQQVVGDAQLDSGAVESQVEVMKSEGVAQSVVRDLKLTEDPEFQGGSGLIGSIASALISDTVVPSNAQLERRAIGELSRNTSVRRVGLTYVIQLDYTSLDPGKAAQVANAVADAYMVGELEAKYQATKRASRWLQDRIKELRLEATEADRRVSTFKSENNIVDTGRGLMSEQQLADVNTQVVQARASTAEAKARLDRITEISRGDIPDATVADALRNDVITRLRAQYLDLSAKEADWSTRYGVNHTAAVNLRNQMREIRRSIQDELRRIAETYKSEYEIARAREQSIQESLAGLVGQAATTGEAQVQLRDLESSAQTYRNLYDNFLQRFMETTQQQTFPVSEARVITAASPPESRSSPKTALVLAGATVMGLFLGIGAAFGRERLDNVFRTVAQVEQVAGVECLGILPRISSAEPETTAGTADPNLRSLAVSGRAKYVVEAPLSRFTETLRSVKVAADISSLTHEMRVLGVVSAVPNEGKTTVASNMAFLLAQGGSRTLLIDGDLRNPSLTRGVVPDATSGLIEVLRGSPKEDILWQDPVTGLDVLPAVVEGRLSHTAELISSKPMANLLAAARTEYDYIVIDLPPAVPVVDVRAASHLIDGFIYVIEWGATSQDVVLEALSTTDLLRDRMLGAVLNKANPSALKRLEVYKGRYYGSYYSEYGS